MTQPADRRLITEAAGNATYGSARGLDPAPLVDLTITEQSGIRPIDVLADGLLYGHKPTGNTLQMSDDSGATWTQVNANLPTLISGAEGTGLRDLPDGEVLLMLRAGGLYRSSGWSTNKATATWTQVLTCTSGAWILPGGVDVSGDVVIACEYAIPREASRKLSVSTDAGQSFTTVMDLNDEHPGEEENTHWHAVGIDSWTGRLWATHGDGPNNLLYSDDNGDTWEQFESGHQPMSITATEYGIILGSDAEPNGLAFIDRETMKFSQTVTWRGGPSVIGFANRAWRNPADGLVYVAFQSTTNGLAAPIIAATPDGKRGAIVASVAPSGATQPNIRNVMIDRHGKVIAPTLLNGVDVNVVGTRIGAGTVPFETLNKSGALVGDADATSVGIGYRTTAAKFGVGIGPGGNAVSSDSSVAIGNTASATATQGIAVGKNAEVTGTGGVSIGANSDAGSGVSIGVNSASETGVAIGNGAQSVIGATSLGNGAKANGNTHLAIGTGAATSTDPVRINQTAIGFGAQSLAGHGTTIGAGAGVGENAAQGTAIGRNAQATGNASTAIGASAASAHDNGVAIGVGQATTAHAQVRFGPKHIELTEVAAPSAPAADAARLYVKDNGSGKTQLVVKFSDGSEIVLATQA